MPIPAADTIASHVNQVQCDGYTIVPDAIEPELIDALNAELARLEAELDIKPSRNVFEGARTVRIYNLLAYGKVFEQVPVHANILPIVEGVLDRGCLVSSLSSIAICAGEIPQPIHADDQLIPIPKPHPPLVCNTMWALTDFTEENGATRIIPGSHRRDHSPTFGEPYESQPAVMTKGSVMVYDGALWHGGGANRTEARRIGVAMNYCAGYIRQQENQQLGLPRATVKRFSPRLRELVGYGIYNGLIGHIDKRSPAKLLDDDGKGGVIWDQLRL
ncbi:MAG TPA: phytanoyl-CoA dioxygenase family protein [Terriglobales bacterium]|nr:phytanoyl-CoA dioxygenase family protein [Terriglobales bacterium]